MCPHSVPPSRATAPPHVESRRMTSAPSLDRVREMMRAHGVRRLLGKFLSPNDNSKNQVYLGGDLGVVNVIPAGEPTAGTSGSHAEPIFKAPVELSWLDADGKRFPAPHTQLILYPQYPEVRLSGFLRGAAWAPKELMRERTDGRVLLLGITESDAVVAFASESGSSIANELEAMRDGLDSEGVLRVVPLSPEQSERSSRARLLAALCRVHRSGWIAPWSLQVDGSSKECRGTNCLGVTLESELGIRANGRSEPDFEGWEVKAHTVRSLDRPGSGPITLMTPEPTEGFYAEAGVVEFVLRFGYPDKLGRPDRMNFGGVHRVGEVCAATGLGLSLEGYDRESETMTSSTGRLALIDARGNVAAAWPFASLLAHWQRKHSRAVYVPGVRRREPRPAYRFSDRVSLGLGTNYLRLLDAFATGAVYYDPGIKIEEMSGARRQKRRSQFRVKSGDLRSLYSDFEAELACECG